MVAYNFQRRFVAPIRAGTKRHTIRAERAGRSRHARPGELMQLYFGLRTRHVQRIAEPRCESVRSVRIDLGLYFAEVDGLAFCDDDFDAFEMSDGFTDGDDMVAFWRREHPGVEVFSGLLIRWEPIPPEAFAEAHAGGADVPVP